jgi:hypothetical protein
VDNLDAIALADFAARMFAFRYDLAVDFHRDTALCVAGLGEQIAEHAARSASAVLSIQYDCDHAVSLVVSLAAAKFQCRKKRRPDMPGAGIESNNGQ